jgi:hypothetical protein
MLRTKKITLKQIVMIILVVCLIIPQASMALEADGTATTPKWQFPDTRTHWANKHISKIALLGFAQGDTTGNYAPNSNISQEQVIIMLINMMGLRDEVNMNSTANLSIAVAEWAKPYVVLALGKKLINMQEETAKQDLNWGTKNATREWVTKLIVRAIGQEAQAILAKDDSTGYSDEHSIGSGYAGYINIASSLDIIKGYEADGSFKPNGQITRAEMAVLLGEAEKHLTVRSSSLSSGIVLSLNANSIQIQESSGMIRTLTLDPNAGIYNKGDNTAISVQNISIDDYVNIISIQGIAYQVEISDEEVKMETFTGTLESISLGDLTIKISINNEPESFKYANDVAIISNTGSGLSLSSLTVGSTLELKRDSNNISTDITQIIVKAAPVFKTVVGTIENVQTVNQVVEVKETSSDISVAYPIPSTIVIMNGTRALASLSELYIGDEVTVELKDNVVTSFTVTKSSVIVEEGTVYAVDTVGETISFLTQDKKINGYFVGEDVQVFISGLDNASLSDIQENDDVYMELNGNNLVTKITVKNRTIETRLGLIFFTYDNDTKKVYLKKDKASDAVAYELNESTTIASGTTLVTLATLGNYFTKDKKVDITYSGNRIMDLKLSTKYDGKLVEINTTTKMIKLNSDYYGVMSVNYATVPSVEIIGKTNAVLSDLAIGSTISVILDGNQDKAIQVKSISTQIVQVKTKYPYKLSVIGETSTLMDVIYSSSVPITHYAKSSATYADITDNMFIQVTMSGLTPTAIYIPAISSGKLTSVNSGNGSLTLDEYGKSAKSISSLTNARVSKNFDVTTSLAALAVNDRVSIVTGTNGVYWITVISPVRKQFIAYTPADKKVQLSITRLTDQSKFELADNVYIHKGTQVLTITSLSRTDSVMVYFLNGKIVEIEKL